MNIYELYVINRALDGKDIFSLPHFPSLNIPGFMIDDIKNELIKKKILENDSTFTEKGLSLTNKLRLFKQAEKHIQIGNIAMGILDDNESILLLYNPLLKEYEIEVITSADMAGQLSSFYSFLTSEGTDETTLEEEVKMSKEVFNASFTLDEDCCIHMYIQDKGIIKDEIYFLSDSKYYVYDSINFLLNCTNNKGLICRLKERLQAE